MDTDELRQRWRASWRATGQHAGIALFDHITRAVDEHGGDLQVFIDEHGRQTYSIEELYERALSVATAIGDLGIGVGDSVAVHMAHTPETVIAYMAVSAVGATLVPIPSIYSDRETGFILADSGARMLITAASWRGHGYLSAITGYQAAGQLQHVVVGGGDPQGYTPFADLLRVPAGRLPALSPLGVERPTTIIYTSGSTANPKGVVHSDDTIAFEVAHTYSARRTESVWFHAVPAGHMSGYLSTIRALLRGGPGVWLDRWNPNFALELVREYKITAGTLVPFHLMTLLEAMERAGLTQLHMDDILCGSTTVPTSLIENAASRGIAAYRCYGSTEHPTISKSGPDEPLVDRSQTDGPLLPGVDVRIVDENGIEVPEGTDGEITSRGPDLMLGYTHQPDNIAAFGADGYYLTGDIGHLNAGVLTITGRKKEIIIRGGENISVREIEELLLRHPAVAEAAVVPRSHDHYGEQVWAFVRTRDNQQLSLEEVRKHFHELGVARQKTPEGVVVIDEFPRTAAGKVSKRDLRSALA